MQKTVEERIDRIINHLLPETAFAGRYRAPKTLYDQLTRYNTPGVSIAVINNFALEWARGFGVCEAGQPAEVTPQTLFQAGSISKPVFALAVMGLVQIERLDLDEDINTYLKSWRVPANEGWQPRITLRQLLSHSAGLTVHGFLGYQHSEALPTVPQILSGEPPANSEKVEVNILPGVQFRYSGGGTTVAQQALIDTLDKPLPEIMRTLVLDPLGMADSTFEQPLPDDWAARAATAHPWKGIPLRGKHHIYPEMAAAGLWTTPSDLAKVGVALLKGLQGKGDSLLTKETIEVMLSSQLPGQEGDEFAGLGFFCNSKADGFYFGHGGWDEGFVAEIRLCKETGQGAVVMLNSNEGHPLLSEIIRAIAQEYEWPNPFPQEKTPVSVTDGQDFRGLYAAENGMEFRVSIKGDTLMLQYGTQPALPILPASDVEFFTRVLNTNVRFEKDDEAGSVSLIVSQEGNQIKADRQGDGGE